MITRDSTRLGEAAYQTLLKRILSTEMPGGTVIQERKLAADMNISRTPMREAVGRLEGEGLLIRLTERLVAVRVISLEDYLQALDVRMLLEPSAAALAATGKFTHQDYVDLSGQLERLAAQEAPAPDEHWAFDDLLHSTVALRSGNKLMTTVIDEMRRYTTIFERQTVPTRGSPGVDDHRLILKELDAGNADGARQAMANHLARIRQRVLDKL